MESLITAKILGEGWEGGGRSGKREGEKKGVSGK